MQRNASQCKGWGRHVAAEETKVGLHNRTTRALLLFISTRGTRRVETGICISVTITAQAQAAARASSSIAMAPSPPSLRARCHSGSR